MKNLQRGFTLIELVIVIVILGILAAVAIPKYIDLKADAAQAAVNGVAGSLSSANAVNYAARSSNSAKGAPVANCTDSAALLQGGLPSGAYVITSALVAVGTAVTCTLTYTVDGTPYTATFAALGIA